MSRTIPEIREAIHVIANRITPHFPETAKELHDLADETKRRAPVRRAPIKNRRVTRGLAQRITDHAALNPEASMQEIAVEFNVNAGRVSEILAGKRGEQ